MMKWLQWILFTISVLGVIADHKKPRNYVYDYVLTFGGDGKFDPTPKKQQFLTQFMNAGFTKDEMIQEGKDVAEFYLLEYGVDATNLARRTYLAPNESLPNGVTFTYVTINPSLNFKLIMASKRSRTKFFNAPISAVWYTLDFSADYISTGSYVGTIPAGSSIVNGNYLIKLGKNKILPRRLFIKYACEHTTFYEPGPFLPFNCTLTEKTLGCGELKGLFVLNPETGNVGGREVLTF